MEREESPSEVDYSSRKLLEIPKQLLAKSFSRLITLNLETNELRFIPPELFKNLPDIRKLKLSNNNIEQLPGTIGFCVTLETLHLEHNNILKLPDDIRKLTRLQRLYLHDNSLDLPNEMVESLFSLKHLRVLTLQHNPISEALVKICEWKVNPTREKGNESN